MSNQTKGKYTRRVVGSVIKSNDPEKPNYMKFRLMGDKRPLTIEDGMTLSVESKAFQLKNLEKATAAGKLSEELSVKIRERIEKIPDFVLGEIVLVQRNN